MCQSKKNGGRRCNGKGQGSHYPAAALRENLVNQGAITEPKTPEQALHMIALASEGYTITDEIKQTARSFDVSSLSPQQQWETWSSLAEAEKPSAGLKLLHELGFEENYPALRDIRGVPQSPFWHPEGSVEKHIQEAGDIAAGIAREQGLSEEDTHVAVLGAISHDFGKATHTQVDEETGRITSYGHDKAGVDKARGFLAQIGASDTVIKQVPPIVGEHMCHIQSPTPKSAVKLERRLQASGTTLEAWTRVADSDIGGRGEASEPSIAAEWLKKRDEGLEVEQVKPKRSLVNGKFLIGLGYKPGPHFGDMVQRANEAYSAGEFTDEKSAEAWVRANL